MFFQESETIVRKHPDLQHATELVDTQLSTILSPLPLRPGDFTCVIECDENQVVSVFELFEQEGILASSEMVECERCQNLMSAVAFRQAIEDEDDFECSSCQRSFRKRTQSVVIYRMTTRASSRPRPCAQTPQHAVTTTVEEPLAERAQLVLVAMLELGLVDSDAPRSTAEIAVEAIGREGDANSLKNVMADLNTRRLIESKEGRCGGCWLTETGKARAEKLRNRLGTVCAPIKSANPARLLHVRITTAVTQKRSRGEVQWLFLHPRPARGVIPTRVFPSRDSLPAATRWRCGSMPAWERHRAS